MNKPSTRADIRASGITVGRKHPEIQDEQGTSDTEPPEGIFDFQAETETEFFWRQWNASDGKDF